MNGESVGNTDSSFIYFRKFNYTKGLSIRKDIDFRHSCGKSCFSNEQYNISRINFIPKRMFSSRKDENKQGTKRVDSQRNVLYSRNWLISLSTYHCSVNAWMTWTYHTTIFDWIS